VIQSYALRYPGMLLGLSDHTPGHATVLGAIALGARVVEKHFTDDNNRSGPDHIFSMNPRTWRDMVDRSRELEAALGSSTKVVEDNERDTVVLQQRCLRLVKELPAGHCLVAADLEALRPAPADALKPYQSDQALGRHLRKSLPRGQALTLSDLE
jgi:N-acetylneuraminate synthase